jgi:hypothetical protein
LKQRDEDVVESVCRTDREYDVEYELLPFLGEDSQEEEAEGDLEEGCCEDVEDFG